jgi:hypothetical protein
MRDIGKHSNNDEKRPTAENWSLPGKYAEIFQEVERALRRFRRSKQSEEKKLTGRENAT